jgi:hypothetical protein
MVGAGGKDFKEVLKPSTQVVDFPPNQAASRAAARAAGLVMALAAYILRAALENCCSPSGAKNSTT